MNKKIISALISAFIIGLCLCSITYTPQKIADYIPNEEDVIASINIEQAAYAEGHECEFSTNQSTKYVVVKLKSETDNFVNTTIYIDEGDGFSEENKYNRSAIAGSRYVVYELPVENYTKLKLIVMQTIDIVDSVEFHENPPEMIYHNVGVGKRYILLSIVAPILAGVFGYFVEKKFLLFSKICESLKRKQKTIIKGTLIIAANAVLAGIINLIISSLLYHSICFNQQLYVFIVAISMTTSLLWYSRNFIDNQVEKVVAGLILLVGCVMIFGTATQFISWDIDSHYFWALESSYIDNTYYTDADFDFYYAYSDTSPKEDRAENLFSIQQLDRDYTDVIYIANSGVSIAHLPAGLGMALSRFFRLPYGFIYKSGGLMNLLLYTLLIYLGMKRLKQGKLIMAVIALFPTCILMASSYSYDFWVIGFSMLGLGYFIGSCQTKDTIISVKDTVIMVAALAVSCIPKLIYVPILLIPFFMPRKKIENKKIYYWICISGLILLCFMFILNALNMTTGIGDVRGGSEVNPSGQIMYILANPLEYANTLIGFLKGYLSLSAIHIYTLNLAYLGIGTIGADIIILLMIITAFTDKGSEDQYSSRYLIRGYGIAMYFVMAAMVATALYISYTAVGSKIIMGCQSRYLIPLLYPMLSSIGSARIVNQMNRKLYNYLILGSMMIVTYINLFLLVISRMI